MQATVPIVMGGCVLHFFQLNSIQRSKDFNVAQQLDTYVIRRTSVLVYVFGWIVPYSFAIGWAYHISFEDGTTYWVTVVSLASNVVVATLIISLGLNLRCLNKSQDFQRLREYNRDVYDTSSNVYLMHAIWWSAGVIVLNCFFLNHNDFFKLFGASGTPRDMKNYTWVIYVTGIFNACQSVAVANFVILMGHYSNGWID